MTAKEFAEKVFDRFSAQLVDGARIPLVEYRDVSAAIRVNEDHADAVDWIEQRRRNTELAELVLRNSSAIPVVVQIDPDDYFQWLENMGGVNALAARAQYAAWVVAGRPDDWRSMGGIEEID